MQKIRRYCRYCIWVVVVVQTSPLVLVAELGTKLRGLVDLRNGGQVHYTSTTTSLDRVPAYIIL